MKAGWDRPILTSGWKFGPATNGKGAVNSAGQTSGRSELTAQMSNTGVGMFPASHAGLIPRGDSASFVCCRICVVPASESQQPQLSGSAPPGAVLRV